jgi:HEAT repeat protein
LTELSEAAQRLIGDYRRAGGSAHTLGEIHHFDYQPTAAIPVLAEWLTDLEDRWPGAESEERSRARESLIRALDVKQSRNSAAIPALISQFDTTKTIDEYVRWAAGNSLYDIPADDTHFDDLVRIATDRTLGMSRQMVVNWLWKSRRKDEAGAVALGLIDDETVQGHALEALARLRTQGIREQIEPFLSSKNRYYRQRARRIIDHLND